MKKKNDCYIIGTSGYQYSDWRGLFYPEKLPKKKWFQYYQTNFKVVEINSTFYRLFNKSVFKAWRVQANNDFHYIVKLSRYITHIKRLKYVKTAIKKFCKMAYLLEDRLALILMQLPPSMKLDFHRLDQALSAFPEPNKVVVEFRNKTWLTPEVKKLLKKYGATFCIAESPNMNVHAWLTSNIAYIRLHGRTKWFDYNYQYSELKSFALLAKKLHKHGAKKVYILFNNDYYSYSANNAKSIKKLLDV